MLFVGLGCGVVIGLSFGTQGQPWKLLTEAPASAPAPAAHVASAAPAHSCHAAPLASANVAKALGEARPLRVGVFGDSFGEGLSTATHISFQHDPRFEVYGFAKQSTGFTRYRTLNLLKDTEAKLNEQPIDLAIVSFGANATQGAFADGQAAPYMSPAWQKVIGARAEELVHLLQARGAVVVWVGLPIMRNAEFDRQTRQMNAFYAERMCALGVRYIDALPASLDEQGQFNTWLLDPTTHQRFQARAMDGIHMSNKGYTRIIAPLLRDMQGLRPQPQGQAAEATAKAPA